MRKIIFFAAVLFMIFTTGCGNNVSSIQSVGKVGEYSPVTRAEVAKMLAFSHYNKEDINSLPRIVAFTDTDSSKWYDKYINAAFTAGLISGADETHYKPEEYLTLRQAQYLITKVSGSENIKLEYADEDRNKPISYSMWCEGFFKATQKGNCAVTEENTVVTADGSLCPELGIDFWLTDKGLVHCEGITDRYTNSEIRLLKKDNEILAVEEVVTNQPKISGVSVLKKDKKGVTVKITGGERFFFYDGDELNEGDVVDVRFEGDKIVGVEK